LRALRAASGAVPIRRERRSSTTMDPENRNVGKPWSAMDLFDLKNSLAYGSSVKEIAEFLMRREIEVREKMLELGLKERRKLT
jgi:hypothetical protein